ncbi:MAG: hypothetical protein AMK75_00110 [Planctomycetes bacterium SM23_65]|nr:MAG: hypothetical protein AMK75_00110 [Planctomycetes bacterium SM23_65]
MSNFYGESFQDKLRGMLRNTPWWAISLLVHGVILTFAYGYTWEIPLPKDEVRIDTSIREKLELPPVMLDLPKPVTEDQKIQPKRITDVKRVQLSQKDLPQLEDILKKRATPNPGMAVLAAPGGVMRVGSIGEGTGFHLAGGLDGAIGDMSGWPGWRERCLAVWLFDESKSMKDDQQIVRQKVDELYESLGIDLGDSRQKMRIVTAVASYGKDFHIVLKEPTTDMDKVRAAIDRIRVDDSGKENYLMAINRVLTEYARYARKYSRNIVIVMVTDEGGDDDTNWQDGPNSPLERTRAHLKRTKATLLVFGNEAGGFNYSAEQTYDPTVPKGVSPYAWVNRGIESGFGEMFPHDWYFRRTERVPSGFGPYGPSRLCKETGGVYYLLRATSAKSYDYEKLLSGYQPELDSRTQLAKHNKTNPARRVLMGLVDGWIAIRDKEDRRFRSYYHNSEAGVRQMEKSMQVVDEWIRLMNDGIKRMKDLSNVAFKDSPKRWEANRLLMWAELHKQRFRLTQYKLALTDLMRKRNIPPPGDIGWHIGYWRNVVLRGDLQKVHEERKKIEAMFQEVIDKHAGTPWEVFARREMHWLRGFSINPWSSSRPSGVTHEAR